MFKFTERIGDYELSYEGDTVQDVINLKKALNPSVIKIKEEEIQLDDLKKVINQVVVHGANRLKSAEQIGQDVFDEIRRTAKGGAI
ncbi:hypothetical protein ACQCN2_01040 [Brevibacillus ginsengisoli]|uniref:hypothetical protein n=1 Tax=Brevibacillus ginsengisoli TaxID=363854 RepID=UPI003CE740CE